MGVEDETGILQQRVEVAPVHREIRQGAGEGIGGEQHEGGEAHRDKAEHPEHPRHRVERQATAEEGDRRRPAPRVSTQSSSEPSWAPTPPRCGIAGQQAVGVGGHVLHGEVVVDKGPGEAENDSSSSRNWL
jgi:hypothetical protein